MGMEGYIALMCTLHDPEKRTTTLTLFGGRHGARKPKQAKPITYRLSEFADQVRLFLIDYGLPPSPQICRATSKPKE
jgi:hypothetical protein